MKRIYHATDANKSQLEKSDIFLNITRSHDMLWSLLKVIYSL